MDNPILDRHLTERNFALNEYKDSIGRKLPMHKLDRDFTITLKCKRLAIPLALASLVVHELSKSEYAAKSLIFGAMNVKK